MEFEKWERSGFGDGENEPTKIEKIMEAHLIAYRKTGLLDSKNTNGNDLLILTTPSKFIFTEEVVSLLKNKYKADEEVGGMLWVKPQGEKESVIYLVEKVSFIRNAIEDKPRADQLNKSNAYLPDADESNTVLSEISSGGYLPMKFHTHPVKGANFLQEISYSYLKTETSDQDKFESTFPLKIGTTSLLMPRCLIVGNDSFNSDLFIGIYNGFVAPQGFEDSKKNIQAENIERAARIVSSLKLTDNQKMGIGLGAALMIFAAIKYPKYSFPVIMSLAARLPLMLSSTDQIKNPPYYNRLTKGRAEIFIPNV
ncbi:MAG: hypothetical protein IPM74_12395 [Crocinitomicaceae bacterium]|nr:hypothetical protein [Crocinitomicaceae bacterium]